MLMPSPASVSRRERRGYALVLLSTVAYGTMPVLARLAYDEGMSVFNLLAWRFAIAAALFEALAPRRQPGPAPSALVLYGLGLVFVGNSLAYFLALDRIPVSMLSLLLYTYPVIVTLLAAVLGLEALRLRNLAAGALAFTGAGLTAGAFARADAAGVALALASALIYSLYIVLGSRFAAEASAERAARYVTRTALAVYLVLALARGELALPPSFVALLLVLAIGGLCTVLALRAFLAGLACVGPARASVLSSFEVIVTLSLAALVLGEPLHPRLLVGGALILGGVALQHARRRSGR
jgi:drug/metabolite transporter (DMT)-like permease